MTQFLQQFRLFLGTLAVNLVQPTEIYQFHRHVLILVVETQPHLPERPASEVLYSLHEKTSRFVVRSFATGVKKVRDDR